MTIVLLILTLTDKRYWPVNKILVLEIRYGAHKVTVVNSSLDLRNYPYILAGIVLLVDLQTLLL